MENERITKRNTYGPTSKKDHPSPKKERPNKP